MAFKKRGSSRPQYSISTSIFVRKGKYIKGPSFGLWLADNGPMARGSVKEDYLQELSEFLAKAVKRDMSVSFALFKNKSKKDEDDDGEEEDEENEDEENDEEGEEEDEEKEERRSSRKSSKSSKSGGKSSKKSSKKSDKDWDFDDDD